MALAFILTTLLAISNAVVYAFGPRPWQIAGNGFHPVQLLAGLLSLGLTVAWLIALRRAAGREAALMPVSLRVNLALIGLLAGLVLMAWAGLGLERYQEAFAVIHGPRRSMGPQYALVYWAEAWPLWLGLACLGVAWGLWRGERGGTGGS